MKMMRVGFSTIQSIRSYVPRCHAFRQASVSGAVQQAAMFSHKSMIDRLFSIKERLLLNLDRYNVVRKVLDGEKNGRASQQMTQNLLDMIAKEASLESMLGIVDKQLPKMTLADKVLVQDLLTKTLYNSIVENSPIFYVRSSRKSWFRTVYNRLYLEGNLRKSVAPLVQTSTFHDLVLSISGQASDMRNWQVLQVFYNLQLVAWPKESPEMIAMFEKVEELQAVLDMEIDDLLMLEQALYMYNSAAFENKFNTTVTRWSLKKNGLENHTDVHTLLSLAKMRQHLPEKLTLEIQRLVYRKKPAPFNSLFLLSIISLLKQNQVEFSEKFLMEVLEQVRVALSDLKVADIMFLYSEIYHLKFYLDQGMRQVIREKCLELLAEDSQKFDIYLRSLILLWSCDDDFSKRNDLTTLKARTKYCLQRTDLNGLIDFTSAGPFKTFSKYLDLDDYIYGKIKDKIVNNSLETWHIASNRVFHTLTMNIRESIAVKIRDEFLDNNMKTLPYSGRHQRQGLMFWTGYPRLTPKSIEFLENIYFGNNLNPYDFMHKFFMICRKARERTVYKTRLTKAGYSRCNTALSMLNSSIVRGICLRYRDDHWDTDDSFTYPVYLIHKDPVLLILSTEKCKVLNAKLGELWMQNPRRLAHLYSHSAFDAGLILNYVGNALNFADSRTEEDFKVLLRALIVDNFFNGGYTIKQSKLDQLKSYLNKGNTSLTKTNVGKGIMPFPVRQCIREAFEWKPLKERNMMVLLDRENQPVDFSEEKLRDAKKLNLKKVAFFYREMRLSGKLSIARAERNMETIKDLTKQGFKCIVIWDQEFNSIAYSTLEEKVKLIQSKVLQNSMKNTAAVLSYDLIEAKEGPYKEYLEKV